MEIKSKMKKYIKKPHIAIRIVLKISFNYIKFFLRREIMVLKYKIKNKRVIIEKKVNFHQKTILSGKGKIIIKNNVSIGYKIGGFFWNSITEIQARYPESQVIISEDVAFNNSNFIIAANKIQINSGCRIGANVTMMDFEAHGTKPDKRNQVGKLGEIIIGNNVWIGNNVIILKNAIIGDNSIIAAGSVVLKGNYPNNCIIGGNPAKVIKYIEEG